MLSFLWQPDPMIEAMEAVVGNHDSMGGELAAAEADNEVFTFTFIILSYCDFGLH